MLKALHQELGSPAGGAGRTDDRDPDACRCYGCASRRAGPFARKSGRGAFFRHARASISRAPPRRPGTSSSISTGRSIDYAVGDAFGLFPTNDPALADAVIAALGAPADFPIGGRTLREVLIDGVSLGPAPDMLFQLFSYITGGDRRQKAKALAAGEDPDGDAATLDVLAAIQKFSGVRPDPEAFIEALDPLQPRLYSIASSPKVDPGATRAHGRYGALSDQRPHSARRRLHVSRRPRRARATGSRSTSRRRSTSDCRPTRRCRSS